jgi:two-component system KDP operon response regulator KdpE
MAETVRILSIEDEREIRRFLRSTLGANGMELVEAETGKAGLQKVTTMAPDIILLDLGLPDMHGMDVLRQVREWALTPIIIISACGQDRDKIDALEAGADDYLTKPFSPGELIARIKVALRRTPATSGPSRACYEYDGLFIDFNARRVRLDGEDVHLTPIEYKLLRILAQNTGRVLTHSALLREVWSKHTPDHQVYLRIHTQHLREKLKDDPINPRFIITEPGIGYRLKP